MRTGGRKKVMTRLTATLQRRPKPQIHDIHFNSHLHFPHVMNVTTEGPPQQWTYLILKIIMQIYKTNISLERGYISLFLSSHRIAYV